MSSETTRFVLGNDRDKQAESILTDVMNALNANGYNPINQLVGYFISGDPTYITNHQNARAVIRRMERDELLEVILKHYIKDLSLDSQFSDENEDSDNEDYNYKDSDSDAE